MVAAGRRSGGALACGLVAVLLAALVFAAACGALRGSTREPRPTLRLRAGRRPAPTRGRPRPLPRMPGPPAWARPAGTGSAVGR
jgi:hypothetical protein